MSDADRLAKAVDDAIPRGWLRSEIHAHLEDNARLQAEIEALKALLRDPVAVHVAMLRGEIARPPLREFLHVGGEKELAEYDALRADAERYRWLRHGDNDEHVLRFSDGSPVPVMSGYAPPPVFLLREEELDAAIDAARAAK